MLSTESAERAESAGGAGAGCWVLGPEGAGSSVPRVLGTQRFLWLLFVIIIEDPTLLFFLLLLLLFLLICCCCLLLLLLSVLSFQQQQQRQ